MNANKTPTSLQANPSDGRIRPQGVYVGIVKNNTDPQNMNRLSVWIPEMGGDPKDETSWFIVSYASNFAGATPPTDLKKDGTDMDSSQKSYGMWMQQPHVENEVLVCFANGDTSRGYWFACLYPQNMNHMVPGLPANTPTDKSNGDIVPVVEYNKWSNVSPKDPPRPSFTPLAQGLKTQGLSTDKERGPSNAGARRESPTMVMGLLSQNQNSVHIDDHPDSECIRMRTRSGVQVLIHETSGYVYVCSKAGNWLEVSDSGIDMFSQQSLSVRSAIDLNFHADRNIIFNAGGAISMKSGKAITLDVAANLEIKVGANANLQVASKLAMSGSSISEKAGTITRDGSISDNGGGSQTASAAVPAAGGLADVDSSGNKKTTNTIVSRMPSHEPWASHPKEGMAPTADTTAIDTTTAPGTPVITPIVSTALTQPTIGPLTGTGLGSLTGLTTSVGGLANSVTQQVTSVTSGAASALTGALSQAQGAASFLTGSGVTKAFTSALTDLSPVTSLAGLNISQNVLSGLKEASTLSGQNLGYLTTQAANLSGFNSLAKSLTSSAGGLFQFTDASWSSMVNQYGAQYGVGLLDRFDPRASSIMGGLVTAENSAFLTAKGLTANVANLNFAQLLGAAPAAKLIAAATQSPTSALSAFLPASAQAHRSLLYAQDGTPKTVSSFYNSVSTQFTSQVAAMTSALGALNK